MPRRMAAARCIGLAPRDSTERLIRLWYYSELCQTRRGRDGGLARMGPGPTCDGCRRCVAGKELVAGGYRGSRLLAPSEYSLRTSCVMGSRNSWQLTEPWTCWTPSPTLGSWSGGFTPSGAVHLPPCAPCGSRSAAGFAFEDMTGPTVARSNRALEANLSSRQTAREAECKLRYRMPGRLPPETD